MKLRLVRLTREINKLIDAIVAGVSPAQVKDRIGECEARKTELQAILDQAEAEAEVEVPVLIHPAMGQRYRAQVAALCEALNAPDKRSGQRSWSAAWSTGSC